MVKETEANLPVDWSFVGGNGGNGSNPELADESKRFVQIFSEGKFKGFGYIYWADDIYVYVACHYNVFDALAGRVDITYAEGKVVKALVIGANITQGVGALALMRPQDWAAQNPKEMDHVITGDTVYLGTGQGFIGAQVHEPYWGAKYPKGLLEGRDVGMALIARLSVPYSKQLLGAGCFTRRGSFTGFVSGRDPETGSAVMVRPEGISKFLSDTKEAFAKFMKDKGYNLDDLIVDYEKYEDMRLWLAGLGAQTFFGFSYIVKGRGASARIYLIDVPTSVNTLTGQWKQPSYRPGVDVGVATPVNSNLDFMVDFNRYRSTASCTLKAFRWAETKTGLVVEMSEGHPTWPVALDIVAAPRLSSFTAKMQWDFADGRPPITKGYKFECDKEVEDKMPNGTTIIRPISQLSSLVTNLGPRFVRWQVGTTITSIEAFLAGQTMLFSRTGHGVVGDYAYYGVNPYRGGSAYVRVIPNGGSADVYWTDALTEYANTGVYPGGVNLAHWHDYLGVGDRVRGDRFHNFALNYWGNN